MKQMSTDSESLVIYILLWQNILKKQQHIPVAIVSPFTVPFSTSGAQTHTHHHIHTPRTGTVSTPSSHHVHYCTHHGYICLANHIPKPDKVKGSFISPQYLAMEPKKERKLAFQE